VIERQARAIAEANEKSERLLANILPASIATRLKDDPRAIADRFAVVTVLFADIIGFTEIAERLEPEAVVAMLNDVFSAFDALADRHGVEKIKTIGDAYMVAGGLPVPRPDHAVVVVEMALDMLRELERINTERALALRLRIGINSGPVVAGVIGTRKLVYDLWGDAVNVASRMESHGVAGAIQVTEETHALLGDRYLFEARGALEVKGKGAMTTYLVRARAQTATPPDPR
jgi:class 3 adenylate cyclase